MPAEKGGRVIDLGEGIVATDEIAKQLEDISAQMEKMLKGRLTEEGIIILIKELLPRGSKLGVAQIREVLRAAKSLNHYVKKGQ